MDRRERSGASLRDAVLPVREQGAEPGHEGERLVQHHVVVRERDLDETFVHPRSKREMNLRWVLVHMIEEYARHNGHADLLRERLDGMTGA